MLAATSPPPVLAVIPPASPSSSARLLHGLYTPPPSAGGSSSGGGPTGSASRATKIMDALLAVSFGYISSRDTVKIRKGLRQIEGLLTQICLTKPNRKMNNSS